MLDWQSDTIDDTVVVVVVVAVVVGTYSYCLRENLRLIRLPSPSLSNVMMTEESLQESSLLIISSSLSLLLPSFADNTS
jgi:hypothetical protein